MERMEQNKKIENPEEFIKLFSSLKPLLMKNGISLIEEINNISLYANKEGTYFTAKFDKTEYVFHLNGNNDDIKKIIIPEQEELLVLDAFEDLYEVLYKRVYAEKIRYEKIVDKLFEAFLKRRKKTPVKKYLEASRLTSKIYI